MEILDSYKINEKINCMALMQHFGHPTKQQEISQ
jgi:hypothetical protein